MTSASSSGDILSQALLQTGLSTPVKVESDSSDFFFPLPHEDVQNIVGQPSQGPLPNNSAQQQNLLPSIDSPAGNSGLFNSGINVTNNDMVSSISKPHIKQEYYQNNFSNGISNNSAMTSFNDSGVMSSNSGFIPVSTSGLAPTSVTGAGPLTQQNNTASNSAIGSSLVVPEIKAEPFNDFDIDLGDLLSIPTPDFEMETSTTSNSISQPHSQFSVTQQVRPQAPFPGPGGPSLEFHSSMTEDGANTDLPVLDDIFNFIGDEGDFLDKLGGNSPRNVNSAYSTPVLSQPQVPRPSFGGPSGTRFPLSSGTTNQFSSLLAMTRDNRHVLPTRGNLLSMGPPRRPRINKNGPIPSPIQNVNVKQEAEGDSDEEDDEDYGLADTYANYMPSKLKLGRLHPDSIVESSSLSSVDPPDVYLDLKLPQDVIEQGKLSSLQLESVVYACQQHMNILADGTRAGFLVGDGAGVGKGRTIAGIIYQNYMEGRRKALWLSVSNDLRFDAIRDLKDVGAKKIDVHPLNKFHYGKISGKRNGRVRKGVIFATYSSLIGESASGGKYRTRLNQLLHWLGPSFEGVLFAMVTQIVFDECHKAKNLVPTGASRPSKTGTTVLQLQKKLPKARIVYCSATGASEPKNMAYMSRLGIWGRGTQFDSFQNFIKAVEKRGVGAMEIVAIDMKLRGMYMARQLSFAGVTFSINQVELSDKFKEAYDASVKLWSETRRLFQQAADVLDYDKKKLKTMWAQFWASHQRFFKYMCIAAKVPEAIALTKRALEDGKCVVIGLQSTGEARTLEQLERSDGDLSGFVSTAKGVLETLIRRHFPVPAAEPGLAGIDWSMMDNDPTLPRSCKTRRRRVTRKAGAMTMMEEVEGGVSSDSDSSSGSPEKSDSAVESSSDEGSSEGSGSSSSDSDGGDDGNANPFASDFAEPWLQRKKVKRKRRRSPDGAAEGPKRKKNYSIRPPPHSSQKGKTKTGFNSTKLKFESVQSPKSSPPLSTPQESPSPASSLGTVSSLAREINNGFTTARSLSYSPGVIGGGANSSMDVGEVLSGQKLTDAMKSHYNDRIPPGLVETSYHRNKLVKDMKDDLLSKLELLSPHLPTNTLDELIDGLGGTQCVAEMTGRRGRVVSTPGGRIQYQLRSENEVNTEMLNIREKQRFMDGEKRIAIISEAASSGISLQADRRVKNRRRRVHLTLELPWSADKAIQQFGRTHRSNQISSPEYIFLISALSGEQRFASIVAKRLESLGALTHGDRRATESRDLSKFNVDTKYGRQALETTLKSIIRQEEPIVKMEDYPQNFFDDCCDGLIGVGLCVDRPVGPPVLDKDAGTMSRFLNRLLGLPVQLQNRLFSYFSDTLSSVIQQARRSGRWDGGIQDFGSGGEQVEIIHTSEYIGDAAYNTATTLLHTVQVERGLPFDEAQTKLETDLCEKEGFYKAKKERTNKLTIVLLKAADSSGKMFSVFRPNTGRQGRVDKLSALMKKYEPAAQEEAKKWWTVQYDSSLETCIHAYWQGKCKKSLPGQQQQCDVGLRRKTHHVLSGSLLGVWSHIENVFTRHSTHSRVQIVRVRTDTKRFVGIKVPKTCTTDMRDTLARIAQQAEGTPDNPITL